MFGYDMSWASFHVLEVMSSAKYLQKRVGYLGAVQSFRPDTEVLMLATNLLKKDIVSPIVPNMSLPLVTLPHIITPSLALSLLTDILPRLSHSHPAVRKKAVVCLYRLALVYPEALRLAWPKIKDRLMDDQEDSSVIAAVINVVCELGWRRPHDFLPLAPRFFELLVDGGNNWMAIKIIKLFATLTPLEPRLIRKLLRPLTNIIQTTTAMSLLYECINGVIQGGILDGAEGGRERDEIASLCVGKLRGMIVMESDPNLKYVALLAFNRIVVSYPELVSMQQDVIMDCLDDADISIRLQALELAVGMVTSETLQLVVNRLVAQLQNSPATTKDSYTEPPSIMELKPSADIEGDDPGEKLEPRERKANRLPSLPNDYRNEVLHRILDICSRDNYSEIIDFEWYVDVLVQLVRLVPPSDGIHHSHSAQHTYPQLKCYFKEDISSRIGSEIRNVAVRVKSVRLDATRAAESLVLVDNRATLFSTFSAASIGVLGPCAWVVGEYAEYLAFPDRALNSLVDLSNLSLPARTLSLYLQAIPKVFVSLTCNNQQWDASRQSQTLLLLARITNFLEALATHPDLDVQERAVEFLELLRLTAEAIHSGTSQVQGAHILLSSVIPGLFSGLELNPVAASAQKKVPLPEELDLDRALNDKLSAVLHDSENSWPELRDQRDIQDFYYVRDTASVGREHNESMKPDMQQTTSYQDLSGGSLDDPSTIARRRAERKERNRDDPFYIGNEDESSGRSTPFHQILNTSNGGDLDIDSIPIIDLAIEDEGKHSRGLLTEGQSRKKPRSRPAKVEIIADETIGHDERSIGGTRSGDTDETNKTKRSLLQVDSSGLGHLSLEEDDQLASKVSENITRNEEEEAEMARAMQDVERLRLEMQRASERIHAQGLPTEGALVKKKKKKKKSTTGSTQNADEGSHDKYDGTTAPGSLKPSEEPDTVARVGKKRKKKSKTEAE
ncbi:hypothetical protein VTN00DRAFT_5948 [Thermoascus crustaceus]|uniref:uncharacterized protein n=1 Tax=Thermoascus crustaceus TaxID=5088 RepID=UPI00374254DA